jgi:DNA-binding transcriptional MerR regulator
VRYTLPELVQASGFSVDTIRYYQSLGLLAAPMHEGRRAIYEELHLDRLRVIRSMSRRGLSLRVIGMLLERPAEWADQALLTALEEEATEPTYTTAELARHLGVPEALITSIESTGLGETADEGEGGARYSESDLGAARGALKLLSYGFPITRLLALAVRHDRAIRRTVDDAIELFDAHVRKRGGKEADPEAVARGFREILPIATSLVVHHFQRVLVRRALKRLRKKGEKGALAHAVEVAKKTRLGVRFG